MIQKKEINIDGYAKSAIIKDLDLFLATIPSCDTGTERFMKSVEPLLWYVIVVIYTHRS